MLRGRLARPRSSFCSSSSETGMAQHILARTTGDHLRPLDKTLSTPSLSACTESARPAEAPALTRAPRSEHLGTNREPKHIGPRLAKVTLARCSVAHHRSHGSNSRLIDGQPWCRSHHIAPQGLAQLASNEAHRIAMPSHIPGTMLSRLHISAS
jgi:hypothetical protein